MNPAEWSWVFPAAALALTASGVYGGWAVGRYKGESAHAMAKAAQERADAAHAALAAYKTEVVAHFATIEMLQKSEDRVAEAINRLADRLDRFFENSSRPAPRTRATKT